MRRIPWRGELGHLLHVGLYLLALGLLFATEVHPLASVALFLVVVAWHYAVRKRLNAKALAQAAIPLLSVVSMRFAVAASSLSLVLGAMPAGNGDADAGLVVLLGILLAIEANLLAYALLRPLAPSRGWRRFYVEAALYGAPLMLTWLLGLFSPLVFPPRREGDGGAHG